MALFGRVFLKSLFILVSIFLAAPLILIIFSWFSAETNASFAYLAEQGLLFLYIKNSILIALGSSLLAVLIGVVSAYFISSTDIAGRRILRWLLILPIAIPSYIAAIIYIEIFSSAGPIQLFIRDVTNLKFGEYWFVNIASIGGAIFILAITLYPYVYLLSFNAFKVQSKQSIESAKLLGLNNLQIFYRLRLPLARPMIFVGVFLVMMESLADFGVVSLLGIPSFTTGIYRAWNSMYDPIAAAQIASILLIFVIAVLWLERFSRRKLRYYNFDQQGEVKELIKLSKLVNISAFIFCVLVTILGFFLPLAVIIYWCSGQIDMFLSEYTLKSLANSLLLGLLVATIASLVGLIIAFTMRYNKQNILFRFFTRIATSGYAMPGSVVAVSILLLLIKLQNEVFAGELFLIGTIFAIVWACVFRFLTISYNNISSSLNNVTPIMDDAAKTLGSSNFAILTKLHIPAIYRTLIIGFLLIFVDTIKELPATILLRPFNFDSLAIRTYELASDELIQYSAPTGLLLILISMLPIWFISNYFLKNN